MLDRKDIKVGTIIWWSADRTYKWWSCPGIITYASRKSFRVKTFDDFKETNDLRMNDEMDDTSRREMRLSSKEEIEQYFKSTLRELEDDLVKRERSLADFKENLAKYKEQVGQTLNSLNQETVSGSAVG